MKKSTKTWMLLLITAGLATVIVLFERGLMRMDRPPQHTVFSVYPESIDRIVTEREGVRIECIRDEAEVWRMIGPIEADVDNAMVQQMIASMARVARGERITPATRAARGLTPADYGFDDPRARITFRSNQGMMTWLVGRDAPLGDSVYVMMESGGDIVAAPRQILHLVPKDPSWIRERALFAKDVPDVRGMDLVRAGTAYRIRQAGISRWEFREPYTGRANSQEVHHLIETLLSGRVAEFVDGQEIDLSSLGFDPPALEISLFTRDERTSTVQLGGMADDAGTLYYARRTADGSLFAVPAEWVEKINRDPVSLRSRSLTDLSRPRVDSVRIQRGEQQVSLVRSNRLWRVQRPVRWDACPEQVNSMLDALLDAPVIRYVDEPTDEQAARMRSAPWEIEIGTGSSTRTVRISAPSADEVRLAKVSGESSLYVIPVSAVREAYADPLFYRIPLVLSIDPVAIQQITLRRDGRKDVVGRRADGAFGSGSDGEGPLEAGALSDLMWLLNDLRVERFVEFQPENLDLYGLDSPKIELTVRIDDPDGTIGRIVRIGNATEGGRFAMVHGQPVVFVLSNESVQAVATPLIPLDEDEPEGDEMADETSDRQ